MSLWQRFFRVSLTSLLLTTTAMLTTPAQSAQPHARPFKNMIGLGVKFSQGQPFNQLSNLEELGVHWVRDALLWSDIEPQAGAYRELPASFNYRLEYYKDHGISVIYTLAYGNGKAYPSTQEQPNAWVDPVALGRYGAYIAHQLKASGVNFVVEVWNEPHNSLAKPLGGQWNGQPPSPWVKHYVEMVREVVKQVKAVDERIKVISCDDMWVLHYWFLEAGLPAALDGFGVHPYSGPSSNGPEIAAVYYDTPWTAPFHVVDHNRSFISAVRRLREQGELKLKKTPEIWLTEWGWPIGGASPSGPLTEETIATYLPRAYILAAAADVEVLCWFSANDSVDGPMGLITNKGFHRLAYDAMKVMSSELGQFVFSGPYQNIAPTPAQVHAYVFKHGGTIKIAAWRTGPHAQQLAMGSTHQVARLTDHLGRDIPLPKGIATRHIDLTEAPMYISVSDFVPATP
jgi:hypothetical protein